MAVINFVKGEQYYTAEFQINGPVNVHIERAEAGALYFRQRSIDHGSYDLINGANWNNRGDLTIDTAIQGVVYPMWIKIESASEPTLAEMVEGEQSGGGAGTESTMEYIDISGLSGDASIDVLTTFAVFFKGTVSGAKMYGTIGLLINQNYTLEALAIDFTASIYSESIGIVSVSQAVEMYGLTSEQLAAIPRITKEEFYSLGSEFVSIRDLYQPTTSDVDMDTGYFDGITNCDKVTEIQVLSPTVYEEVDQLAVSFMNTSKNFVASLVIRTTENDSRLIWNSESATDGVSSGVIYTITPDNVVTRNEEEIDKFNAILAGDDFRYAIANAGAGFTEAQFDILDKFIKVKKG